MGALSQREELEGVEEKRAWDTIEVMPKGGGGWTAKRKFEDRSETIRFLKTGKIEAELELILRFLVCRSKTL